jgi:ferredoxin
MTTLHIDWTRCDARGGCVELIPELLAQDDLGYPLPRGVMPEPLIPQGLRPHAERAVKLCPRMALSLRR